MQANPKIKLIDGVFHTEDASSILTDLIDSKVNFLNREAFSNHIRFSHDINHAETRLKELAASRQMLAELIAQNKKEPKMLKIKCYIEIESEEATHP